MGNNGYTRHRTKTNKTQHIKVKRWATQTPQKKQCWTKVLGKGGYFLCLVRQSPCYSHSQVWKIVSISHMYFQESSAVYTYMLDKLKVRTSQLRESPVQASNTIYLIYNDTVIGLSYLCCHNVMYSLSRPVVFFLAQLYSISEYFRWIPHHPRLYSNW